MAGAQPKPTPLSCIAALQAIDCTLPLHSIVVMTQEVQRYAIDVRMLMGAAFARAGASDSSSTDSPADAAPAAPSSGSGLSLTPVGANGTPATPAAPTPRAVTKAPAPSVAKVRWVTARCLWELH